MLQQNKDAMAVGNEQSLQHSIAEDDEEIASEEEEEGRNGEPDTGDCLVEDSNSVGRLRRKRKRREWILERGKRCYEQYISNTHDRLNQPWYETIDKWNKKLRLVSDRTTNKVKVCQLCSQKNLPLSLLVIHSSR